MGAMADSGGEIAQTLDRGLAVLEALLENPQGLSVAELADHLGVGRSIARRLVITLLRRHLVWESSRGRYQLGPKLVELAGGVQPQLQAVSEPILRELAGTTGETAVLSVADGASGVALASIAPAASNIHIVWRVGWRFPLDRGASGLAMLSLREPAPDDLPEVTRCRDRGWAYSHSELQRGASAVAAPIVSLRWPVVASVGVVSGGTLDADEVGPATVRAADQIGRALDRLATS